MKRIGLIGLSVVLLLSLLFASPAAAAEYGTVTGGWLRLRVAPSLDATIIKSYFTGTVVEILGTNGDWYSVKAPDNQAGFMHKDYISIGGSGGSSGTLTKYVTSANGYGVRLRTGPSKGYRVLAVYDVGTQVSVLQTGSIWSRIQIGTTVGFMMNEYLTSTNPGSSPSTPEGDDMATIWSANGYGVRLRSGPSTSDPIIGLYSVGTRVSVLNRDTVWDEILVGSRQGYMMNEFLDYDNPADSLATSITLTADYSTGLQGEYVDLDVTVTGYNLSTPAYDLEVTGNTSMASIVGDDVYIKTTATVGAIITITATTRDDGAGGYPLSDTCTVQVAAAEPRVSAFSFDETTASASIAGGDTERRIGYTISGVDLSSPPFTLVVSSEAGGYVGASIDTSHEEIVLDISSSIAEGTAFTVTGTTTDDDAGGDPIIAVVTVTITDDSVTLTSIELVPDETALRHSETANISARLNYSDGSYTLATLITEYTMAITAGSDYASLSTDQLVPNAVALAGESDQTVTITGTSVANPLLTDTCDILLYGISEPAAPTLTGATAGDRSVTLTWTAPTDDGGDDLLGFDAYYSLSDGGAKSSLNGGTLIDPGDDSYLASGLINGTPYYFYIVAVNGQGDSPYSNTQSATPNATGPSAVRSLTASPGDPGEIQLTWLEPADTGGTGIALDHYRVYVNDGANPTYEYDTAGRSLTASKLIVGLIDDHPYTFSVLAVNDEGLLGPTESASARPVGIPDAPTVSLVLGGPEQLFVQWTPGDGNGHDIETYDLYYREYGSGDPPTQVADLAVTSYTILGLVNDTTYEVWVTAFNDYHDSAESVHETGMPMAP